MVTRSVYSTKTPGEDTDVSTSVAATFRKSGIIVREGFGEIESFEKTNIGIRKGINHIPS
ncbi:MAG: hypothetical protein H0U75_00265 [Legionella sp.]|nr:hypothetical protein [Legionella sp.]